MPFNLENVLDHQRRREHDRRTLQTTSSQILTAAKRAIFALQRMDRDGSDAELARAKDLFRQGAALIKKDPGLAHEGSWRAAQEEFTEACFFYDIIVRGRIVGKDLPSHDPETVIGGIADAAGELSRYAMLRATARDQEEVERLYQASFSIVEMLLGLDLTGSLRTKFDQAKQHLRKIEEIRYDLSLRAASER